MTSKWWVTKCWYFRIAWTNYRETRDRHWKFLLLRFELAKIHVGELPMWGCSGAEDVVLWRQLRSRTVAIQMHIKRTPRVSEKRSSLTFTRPSTMRAAGVCLYVWHIGIHVTADHQGIIALLEPWWTHNLFSLAWNSLFIERCNRFIAWQYFMWVYTLFIYMQFFS